MFNKKTCPKCYEKINAKHNFCPNCGNKLENGNWGILGRTDSLENEPLNEPPLGGMLQKMIGSAINMIEKEMRKEIKHSEKIILVSKIDKRERIYE